MTNITEVDILLSTKYKEMVGYFNIVNNNNDTILSGNVTIYGNLNISGISILNNNLYVNNITNVNNDVKVFSKLYSNLIRIQLIKY